MRRWICIGLALSGCGGGGNPVVSVVPAASPVDVVNVEDGEFDENWVLDARVHAKRHALVTAQVSGEVRASEVSAGDVVHEGQILMRIDDGLVKARMEAARAKWDEAQAVANASRTLRNNLRATAGGPTIAAEAEKASAKAMEYDARARAARAKLETVSVELVRHQIKSPFAGLIARRHVDVGDHVFHGDVLMELVSIGEVEVWVDAPADAIGGLEPGGTATLEGQDTLVGEILAVIPVVDPETDTVRIRILPSEPRPWLMPGASLGVRLPVTRLAEGRVIPPEALLRRPDGDFVVRVVDGRAVHVRVTILARGDDGYLLGPQGLEVGDEVVVQGHGRLHNGQLLAINGQE